MQLALLDSPQIREQSGYLASATLGIATATRTAQRKAKSRAEFGARMFMEMLPSGQRTQPELAVSTEMDAPEK